MFKKLLAIAALAVLSACGGESGGSGSSTNDESSKNKEEEKTPSDTNKEIIGSKNPENTQECTSSNGVILLLHNESCVLSQSQVEKFGFALDGNIVSCSDGVVENGMSRKNSIVGEKIVVNCERAVDGAEDFRTVVSKEEFAISDSAFDDYVNFDELRVSGNSDYITEDGTDVVQVHGQIGAGRFSVELTSPDIIYVDRKSDAKILLVLTDSSITSEMLLNNPDNDYVEGIVLFDLYDVRKDLAFDCSYDGSLSGLSCLGTKISLDHLPASLPLRANLHFLGCSSHNNGVILSSCRTAISVAIQFN